jgi:hypothetical protein
VVFVKKRSPEFSDVYDDSWVESFLGFASCESELREMIEFLLWHRDELMETSLRELEHETEKLIGQLEDVHREKLLVELQSFRDMLSLQRRLLDHGRS